MLILQVVPVTGQDAYKLLRSKVTHEAQTWSWANKAKTRLRHVRVKKGYVEVAKADGVLVARVVPTVESDSFFLAEKFIGRLIAWFANEIAAINLQFLPEPAVRKRTRRRRR
jgi:hypothetical protein